MDVEAIGQGIALLHQPVGGESFSDQGAEGLRIPRISETSEIFISFFYTDVMYRKHL